MTKRTATVPLVVVVLGTSLGAAWLGRDFLASPKASDEKTPLPVQVDSIQLSPGYSHPQFYTGVVRSPQESELGFERAGTIDEVLVDEGDHVEMGQPIAKLDQRKLLARQRDIKAQLAAEQSILNELEAGPRQQTIAAAKAKVDQLDADIELAKLKLSRAEKLRVRDSISSEEFDQARLGLESLKAQREEAHLVYDELRIGTRKEQKERQAAVVQQLEAAVEEVGLQIEDTTLTAPFAGQVTDRFVHSGSVVDAGSPVVRLVQTDPLEVWIGVPLQSMEQMNVGQTYPLEISGREYSGVLRSALAELDRGTRTQTLVFEIETKDNPAPAIAELARLRLNVDVQREGCWVPLQALARGPRGLWSIYVAEPSEDGGDHSMIRRVDVESIYANSDQVFVRGPLRQGDLLITTGLHRVVPGQKCQPITDDDSTEAATN